MGRTTDPGDAGLGALSAAGLVPAIVERVGAFTEVASVQTPGGQLIAARRLIDQIEALWLCAAADLDNSGAVAEAGFGSLASWMRHTCRLAPGEASGRAKAARAAGSLTAVAQALVDGALTWRHVLVIDQALGQVPPEHRQEAEQSLVDHGRSLDPAELRRVGDRLVHCFDRDRADELAIRRLDRRGLSVAETMDGMVSVSGLLDPVSGAALLTALDAKCRASDPADPGDGHGSSPPAGSDDGDVDVRTWSQRRADALAEICSEWLQTSNQTSVGGVRPHLSVVVDVSTLAAGRGAGGLGQGPTEPAQLAWVGPITASQAQMIGCDSTVSRIVMNGPSQVIDVGRATRTIPPSLRRAVVARDSSCVASGCHRRPEHCDVHHIVFWEHGGATSLENTVLLCRQHHGLVHVKQWRVVIDKDGRRRLVPPD